MNVVHLTSSQFYGGPERQMLGLARALPAEYRTTFVSFSEKGGCQSFLDVVRSHRFPGIALHHDMPHLLATRNELAQLLRQRSADLLVCHGYKANILGRSAARRVGIPVVAVSRGWTGEQWRVRLYDALDRLNLRWMDRVVAVSEAQGQKVLQTGVSPDRLTVIHNAIRMDRFTQIDPLCRQNLQDFFPTPQTHLVGAAGRLSPEKGFDKLIDAATEVCSAKSGIGFVLFGDGPLRQALEDQIARSGLKGQFILAGFRNDLDRIMPGFDLFVLPSYNEGLPNVVLEAFAAKVPVVATAVGGTPEIVEQGTNGFLVAAGNANALAQRIRDVLTSDVRRQEMGQQGHQRVVREFTFEAQSRRYQELFQRLVPGTHHPATDSLHPNLCESLR